MVASIFCTLASISVGPSTSADPIGFIVGPELGRIDQAIEGPDRPIQNEIARATVLSSLKFVDAVVIFAEDTPIDLIKALEPDVLVRVRTTGWTRWWAETSCAGRGGKVVLADIVEGHSTTGMVRRAGSALKS